MKITLRNGRVFEVGPLPLDETGDKVAELVEKFLAPGQPYREERKVARELGLAAVKLFSPTATDAEILSGLDAANISTVIMALNGATEAESKAANA